ncbi:hypothetical protein TY91_02205 [Secundilactobacillus collinoides]|uniref:Uncharacterized protein n=1 Tax=Secundilactobacillus collinoides TaxID=33960 RepID=A0A166HLY3_SECCO|nr:hypothetical protein TY91_02205 [Secundilactobacillus collinoides]
MTTSINCGLLGKTRVAIIAAPNAVPSMMARPLTQFIFVSNDVTRFPFERCLDAQRSSIFEAVCSLLKFMWWKKRVKIN